MRCPHCQYWMLKKDDSFCSWCGIKLVDFKVNPKTLPFYIKTGRSKTFATNKLVITNTGYLPIQEISIAVDPLLFEVESESVQEPIAPGGQRIYTIKLKNPSVVEIGSSSQIVIEAQGNVVFVEASFLLAPKWELYIDEEKIEENSVKKIYKFKDEIILPFLLKFETKTKFQVERVTVPHAIQDWFRLNVEEIKDNMIRGKFVVNIPELENRPVSQLGGETVTLEIKAKNSLFVYRFPFRIELLEPPKFAVLHEGRKVEGPIDLIVWDGIENELEISIINFGHQPVTIDQINFPNYLRLVETVPLIKSFPYTLEEGGREFKLRFVIDVSSVEKEGIIEIKTNQKELSRKIYLFIEKKPLEEEEEYIAIDFGTTNTTAAYKIGVGKYKLITLDKMDEITPSVIGYKELKDNIPIRCVYGKIAWMEGVTSPWKGKRYFFSMKSELGTKKNFRVIPEKGDPGQFTAKEIVSHFLTYVKKKIEKEIKKKVKRFVITHPAKFSYSQISELEEAYKSIGAEEIIRIEEPEAAAIDFILEKEKEGGEKTKYILGVFDFGGGTTDLTMLEVSRKEVGDVKKIKVNVLSTDGDREFGGNNITDALMEIIAEKIERGDYSFTDKNISEAEKAKIRLFYSQKDEEDIDKHKAFGEEWENIVGTNRNRLWQLAERMKIKLSEKELVEDGEEFIFITEEGDTRRYEITISVSREALEERIREKIEHLIGKLKAMEERKNRKFDYILLSGLSSKLPLVRKVISEKFSEEIIRLPSKGDPFYLKNCVVLGALKYYDTIFNPGSLELEFYKSKRLTCSIGPKYADKDGTTKFLELFPQGTEFPTDWKKLPFPLKRTMKIEILENYGNEIEIEKSPDDFRTIAVFHVDIMEEIKETELEKGELFLQMPDENEINLLLKIGDKTFNYSKKRRI